MRIKLTAILLLNAIFIITSSFYLNQKTGNLFVYRDYDGDNFPAQNISLNVRVNKIPAGYILMRADGMWDCNDSDAAIHSPQTYYIDADQDGFGGDSVALLCTSKPPIGFSTNNLDCNDFNNQINPNATEIQDGLDNNCNSQTDEGFAPPTFTLIPMFDANGNADSLNNYLATIGLVGGGSFTGRYNLNKDPGYSQMVALHPYALNAPNVLSYELASYPIGDKMSNNGGFNSVLPSPCTSNKIDPKAPFHNNYGCYNWGNSLMPATLSLCKSLGCDFIPAFRPTEPVNQVLGWIKQIVDSLGHAPKYITIGDEEFLKTQQFPHGVSDYIADVVPIIDSVLKHYPNMKIVLDFAPTDLGGINVANWNTGLLTVINNPKYHSNVQIRAYFYDFHMDHTGLVNKDWIKTLDSIAQQAFPQRVGIFEQAAGVPVCGLEFGRGEGVSTLFPYGGTWSEGYYVAKQVIQFIKYDAHFPNQIGFMSQFGVEAFNLNSKVQTQSYYATILYESLFNGGGTLYNVTLPNSSMDGIAVKDAKGYHLLIVNPTSFTSPITTIQVGNVFYTPKTGKTLSSTSITAAGTMGNYSSVIPAYSVMEIDF